MILVLLFDIVSYTSMYVKEAGVSVLGRLHGFSPPQKYS